MILEDKAQKKGQHDLKNAFFRENGIEVRRVPLPVGDYILANDKVLDVIDRKSRRGIDLKKMDFLGTYDVCVDSKFSIQELITDICGKAHERFRDECILAQNNGIKLYILVENEGGLVKYTKDIYNKTVRSIDDLFSWRNERLFLMMPDKKHINGYYKNGRPIYERVQVYPAATKGETIAKACLTMQAKYGVEFLFCTPDESGRRILELLKGEG